MTNIASILARDFMIDVSGVAWLYFDFGNRKYAAAFLHHSHFHKPEAMAELTPQSETVIAPVRGALVVLEGLDRSGKTTQVKLLEERFKALGKDVRLLRFPGLCMSPTHPMADTDRCMADRSTPIGQMIDNYLKSQVEMDDHVIHLLFAANRWEAAYANPKLNER